METKGQYYSLDNILAYKAHYNVIFGERSNGKTYAVLRAALARYAETGEQLAIIRRYKDDFTGKRGAEMFAGLVSNGVVEELTGGEWSSVYYFSSRWFLCRYEEDKKGNQKRITAPEPFAYGFALTSMEHDKGSSYDNVTWVLFDEFITRAGYLADEFLLFQNTLSTIIRQRDNVTIFMLGNTVNQFCPYFAEMGLTHVKQMEQGTIDLYKMGNEGLRIAVEFCGTARHMKKKSDIYFSFDNPRLEMITNGTWEIAVYPHLPRKYLPHEVVFEYFIDFDKEMLHCEVIVGENDTFTYVHRKSTPLKDPDHDIIYTSKYDPRPNWVRRITNPRNRIGEKILWYYLNEQVYYQDNEVGEIVRNYLQWSGGATNE